MIFRPQDNYRAYEKMMTYLISLTSLYQFADLIHLNAKGFREMLFQGINLLTKASTKYDIH